MLLISYMSEEALYSHTLKKCYKKHTSQKLQKAILHNWFYIFCCNYILILYVFAIICICFENVTFFQVQARWLWEACPSWRRTHDPVTNNFTKRILKKCLYIKTVHKTFISSMFLMCCMFFVMCKHF